MKNIISILFIFVSVSVFGQSLQYNVATTNASPPIVLTNDVHSLYLTNQANVLGGNFTAIPNIDGTYGTASIYWGLFNSYFNDATQPEASNIISGSVSGDLTKYWVNGQTFFYPGYTNSVGHSVKFAEMDILERGQTQLKIAYDLNNLSPGLNSFAYFYNDLWVGRNFKVLGTITGNGSGLTNLNAIATNDSRALTLTNNANVFGENVAVWSFYTNSLLSLTNLVADGDSMTMNNPSGSLYGWPSYLGSSRFTFISNQAISGGALLEYSGGTHFITETYATDDRPLSPSVTGKATLFCLCVGHNDLYGNRQTVSDTFNAYTNVMGWAKADGYTLMAATIPSSVMLTNVESHRIDFNNQIIAWASSNQIPVMRWDTILPTNTANTTYRQDGTHPTVVGAQTLAAGFLATDITNQVAVINPLAGKQSQVGSSSNNMSAVFSSAYYTGTNQGATDSIVIGTASYNFKSGLLVSITQNNLLTGLIAYWKMDETGGTRVDSSSNGYDLITTTTVGSITGVINLGSEYDASSILQTSLATYDASKDTTVSFWVATSDIQAGNGTAFQLAYGTTWILGLDGSGCVTPDVAEIPYTVANSTLFNHIVIVNSTANHTFKIYVNGVIDSTTSVSTVPSGIGADIGIGGYTAISPTPPQFTGKFDEFGIWNRALSADEVSALYNSGAGLPFSEFSITP